MPKIGQKGKNLETELKDVFTGKKKVKGKHLRVIARAGTGKTTTACDLALNKIMGKGMKFSPSKQQKLIVDKMEQMAQNGNNTKIIFCAFSKQIQLELEDRVPEGIKAKTIHGLGLGTLYRNFTLDPNKPVDEYKNRRLMKELTKYNFEDWKRFSFKEGKFIRCVCSLIDQVKNQFIPKEDWGPEVFDQLASKYGIEIPGSTREKVHNATIKILNRCLEGFSKDLYVDASDMIWLPLMLNLDIPQYELVIVDEAQDNNPMQQEYVNRMGGRVVFIGDPKQAIFGFAGSDYKSMDSYVEMLGGEEQVETLYLTETRRCGKEIVEKCKELVPDFEAHEDNHDGEVIEEYVYELTSEMNYRPCVKPGAMILCRMNAPLVRECFWFLKRGKTAWIRGRDIGGRLINRLQSVVKTEEPTSVSISEVISKLDDWYYSAIEREKSKAHPSDTLMMTMGDEYQCLLEFAGWQGPDSNMDNLIVSIEEMFTDEMKKTAIQLCSMHKAKGLEADDVFVLNHKDAPCPHPLAQTPEQLEQEYSLLYVAWSRAINKLYLVS